MFSWGVFENGGAGNIAALSRQGEGNSSLDGLAFRLVTWLCRVTQKQTALPSTHAGYDTRGVARQSHATSTFIPAAASP